jgi:hypothetical protein
VAGETVDKIILATVCLVGDDHDVAPLRQHWMLIPFIFREEFLDRREDNPAGIDL